MYCRKCDGTGMIGRVIPGQREFGGDASTWCEQPCPDCNPQPCPNCKDEIQKLQAELEKLKKNIELHAGDISSAENKAGFLMEMNKELEEENSRLVIELKERWDNK